MPIASSAFAVIWLEIPHESVVSGEYDKSRSTELDLYGNVQTNENKDANRPWINNCLDLYARWRTEIYGADGINISAMQVGETDKEGTNLMVLTIDNDLPAKTLETVKAVDGIFDAKLVNFYAV